MKIVAKLAGEPNSEHKIDYVDRLFLSHISAQHLLRLFCLNLSRGGRGGLCEFSPTRGMQRV